MPVSDRNRFIVYTADGVIREIVFYERNFSVLGFSPKSEMIFSLETPAKGAPKHSLQIVKAFG